MLTKPTCINNRDQAGNPAGGRVTGVGISIEWQNGPLGRGQDRKEPNGAFVESVIWAARERLEHYQGTKFSCRENAEAIRHLDQALEILGSRTSRREAEGVEGTHQGH